MSETASGRKLALHACVRAAITLGFAVYIAYLVKNGSMNLYIAPRMELIVKLSAVVLYVIGMFQIYAAYKHAFSRQPACGCDHTPRGSLPKHALIYGLMAFPLLLGALLPEATMGSALAAKKGINLSAGSSARVGAPASPDVETPTGAKAAPTAAAATDEVSDEQLDAMFEYDAYTESFAELAKTLYRQDTIVVTEELFMEILTTIDLYLDHFIGKKVELSGFVYREPDMTGNQLVVARFAMDCCSADALPYGVLVEYNRAAGYQDDTWLRVNGVIDKTMYNDNEIMMFKPRQLEVIPEPSSPYVYPNYEF